MWTNFRAVEGYDAPTATHETSHPWSRRLVRDGVVPALAIAMGPLVDASVGTLGVTAPTLGGAMMAGGAALRLTATAQLWRAGARPLSGRAPRQLLTRGAFAVVRHPMTLGGVLWVAGLGLVLGAPAVALLSAPILLLAAGMLAVGPEDTDLRQRFGAPADAFADRTPALLPLPRLPAVARAWDGAMAALGRLVNRPLVLRLPDGKTLVFASYGALQGLAAAVITGWSLLGFASHLTPGTTAAIVVSALVLGLVGNRLAGIGQLVWVERVPLREAWGRVRFIAWGLILGKVGAVVMWAWWLELPVLGLVDAVAPAMLLGHVFGRTGCVFYGCCHGPPVARGGLTYHHALTKPVWNRGLAHRAVLPTPILSSLYGVVGFGALFALQQAVVLPMGAATALAAWWFGMCRYAEEFFRYGSGATVLRCSPGQRYALWMAVGGVAVLAWGVAAAAPAWPAPSMSTAATLLREPLAWGLVLTAFAMVGTTHGVHRHAIGRWV